MPILPVKIYHRDTPGKFIIVYAMLDFCSTGIFILQEAAEEIGIETREVPVSIRTVIGLQKGRSECLHGLMVESVTTSGKPLPLPKAYCKDVLPIDYEEIITLDQLNGWDYLERVAQQYHQHGQDIPIGMIIGSNCKKAVEPIECIPSQNGGPFAFRTKLGWCCRVVQEKGAT